MEYFPDFAPEKGVSLGEFPLEAGPCRNWSLLSKVSDTGLGSTTFFYVLIPLQCHRLISATLMMQSHGISSSQICVEKHVFKIQQWSHASKQTLSWPGSEVTVLFAFNTHSFFSYEYHPNLSQLHVLQKIMFVLSAAKPPWQGLAGKEPTHCWLSPYPPGSGSTRSRAMEHQAWQRAGKQQCAPATHGEAHRRS